jgi:hypothetical protein
MPRNPINYTKTIMYKLCCKDITINDIYVGHTTDFKSRKNNHKSSCNNQNEKIYQFIRENGGWDNWDMIMIENYSCNSKLEATKRERELIEELKATLNRNIPSRTHQEWKERNKDKIKENNINYKSLNKDIIKEKDIVYRQLNEDKIKARQTQKFDCECGGHYNYAHKIRHIQTKKHQEYLKVSIPEQNASEIVC